MARSLLFGRRGGRGSSICVLFAAVLLRLPPPSFYFNQISCPSINVCYAVGENDAAAFAYKTADGGNTWDLIFEGEGLSLMSVAALSESEVYLGGGVMSFPVVGYSIYSADGGNTWGQQQIPDKYGGSRTHCSRLSTAWHLR